LIGLVFFIEMEAEEGIFAAFVALARGDEAEIFAVEVEGKK
jgi:hypothetical protein